MILVPGFRTLEGWIIPKQLENEESRFLKETPRIDLLCINCIIPSSAFICSRVEAMEINLVFAVYTLFSVPPIVGIPSKAGFV